MEILEDADEHPPSHTSPGPVEQIDDGLSMSHVAAWRNQIGSAWSSNPHEEKGDVLEKSRPLLFRARSFLQQVFAVSEVKSLLDPASTRTVRAARLVNTHREVNPIDLDALTAEERASGVAIRNTDLTALPLGVDDLERPTMVHIGISRASNIELHLLADARVLLCAKSQGGSKQLSIDPDAEIIAACEELFRLPDVLAPPDKLPIVSRAYAAEAGAEQYYEMPSWLCQRLGQVLQDGFRFHVLLTAATDVSKAVVIEKVLLSIPPSSQKSCELIVRIHASSGNCICAAHQTTNATEPRFVQVAFAFCGNRFCSAHNLRCIKHAACEPNFAPELPFCCLHNVSAKVACRHLGGKEYRFSMDDIPEDSVERVRILAASAMAMVDKKKEEIETIKQAVDNVFAVGEASEDTNSVNNINRDLLAVRILRVGGVQRTTRCGNPSLRGKNLSAAERGLRNTHAFLFKKQYKNKR